MRGIRALLACVIVSITGCSLSGLIDADIADYYDSAAFANNRLLLLNILRAKNNEPIHFSELSVIHGSVQVSAGASATLPFGATHKSTSRDSGTLQAGYQTTPTFDLGTLETQDFTKGIMSPIDPKVVADLISHGGVNPKVALLLFFSEIIPKNHSTPISNSMDCTPPRIGGPPATPHPDCARVIFHGREPGLPSYLEMVNSIEDIRPVQYDGPSSDIGPPIDAARVSSLKELGSLDPEKFKLRKLENGQYQLQRAASSRVAFCVTWAKTDTGLLLQSRFNNNSADRTRPTMLLQVNDNVADVCNPKAPGAAGGPVAARPPAAALAGATLTPRSVFGMIKYLGGILQFQEILRPASQFGQQAYHHCVTLDNPDPTRHDLTCETGSVFFRVNAPNYKPGLSIRYRDAGYSVALSDGCEYAARPGDPGAQARRGCDHSLQVLQVLSLLLNMNKVAKDIPATPSVQVVQ